MNPFFTGLTENHSKECTYQKCFLKQKLIFYIPYLEKFMTKQEYERKEKNFELIFVLAIFEFFLQNNTYDTTILLSYLNFQFEEIGNMVDILIKINNLEIKKASLTHQFSFYRLQMMTFQKLEDNFTYSVSKETKSSYNFDINNVIMYYKLVTQLKIELIESAKINLMFWNSFRYHTDGFDVYESGIDIFNRNQNLDKIYNHLKEIYANNKEIQYKYSENIRLIRGDEKLADKHIYGLGDLARVDEIADLEKINDLKEFFFSVNSVIIIASLTRTRFLIEKVSESIEGIFGFNPQNVIGKDVETIMPSFFKKRHMEFCNFHIDNGNKNMIGKEIFIYGQHKQRYIFPAKILTMELPNLEKKLLYISIIQRVDEPFEAILVEGDGRIDSMTEKISRHLSIPNDSLDTGIYIFQIISSFFYDFDYETFENVNRISEKLQEIKTFTLKPCESVKMCYCTEKSLLEEIMRNSKAVTINTKAGTLANRLMYMKSYYYTLLTSEEINPSNWHKINTEISKLTYGNDEQNTSNDLFLFKVYLDELDVKDEESNNTEGRESGINEVHRKNILLKGIYSKYSKVLLLLNDHQNQNKNVKPAFNYVESIGSGSQNSAESNNFYSNYTIFMKKLERCLLGEHSSVYINLIGKILFIYMLICSILVFIFEYRNIENLLTAYVNASKSLSNFDDLNCVEKNINNIILKDYNSSNLMSYFDQMHRCVENIIVDFNTQTHLSPAISVETQIKIKYLNSSTDLIGFQNDPLKPPTQKLPIRQAITMLLDYLINSQRDNFKIEFQNYMILFKQNIDAMIKTFHNTSLEVQIEEIHAVLNELGSENILFLFLRILIVMISFICFIPFMVIYKNNQIKVLNNFFRIRSDDAELQRECCKMYIKKTSKENLEDFDNKDEQVKGGEIEEELEPEEDADLKAHKKLTKQYKLKKDKDKKNKKDNEKKMSKAEGELKNKIEQKKIQRKRKATKVLSGNIYFIQMIMSIALVVSVISSIPLINFFIEKKIFSQTSEFLDNKVITDNFIYSKQRLYVATQNMFTDYVIKGKTSPTALYLKTFSDDLDYSQKGQLTFSSVFVNYPEINNLLFSDMCLEFDNLKIYPQNCKSYQATLAQQGLNPVWDFLTNTLTKVKQQLLSEPIITNKTISSIYANKDFLLCDYIFDNYIQSGNDAIVQISLDIYTKFMNDYEKVTIILFVVFLVVIIMYYMFIWTKYENNIHELETDTYKLFSIIPLRFIREYAELSGFLKSVTVKE